jgi:hypothetical protein
MSNSGRKDKGKHEAQKKAAHTLKEKRKMKKEGKNKHPEEVVAKIDAMPHPAGRHVAHK